MKKPDIVGVITDYGVPLKPAGTNKFRSPCPFHSENHPSFNVNANTQRFNCFGCGEKGDVIEFVFKMEKYQYRSQAIEHLKLKKDVNDPDKIMKGLYNEHKRVCSLLLDIAKDRRVELDAVLSEFPDNKKLLLMAEDLDEILEDMRLVVFTTYQDSPFRRAVNTIVGSKV